jgi:hypothetical protein
MKISPKITTVIIIFKPPLHGISPKSVGLDLQQFGVSAGRKQSIHLEWLTLVRSVESGQSPNLLRNQAKRGSLERPF